MRAKISVWVMRIVGVELAMDPEWMAARALTRDLGPLPREILRFNQHAVPGRLYAHCFCTAH
jgi:hypothetical protein